MALEQSTSSLDTAMAKQSAINSVIQYGKDGLGKLKSGISSTIAKAGLVSILTFGAGEAIGQTNDVAKAPVKAPLSQVDKKVEGEEPIKDSVEYKKKRAELLKEIEVIRKSRAETEIENQQIKKLMGPFSVFEKMQAEGREITYQDVIWANDRIESYSRVNRVPNVKPILDRTMALLKYIASNGPQEATAKTN